MRQIGAFEAKTHLSALLDAAARGEAVEITRRGKPVARLVPVDEAEEAGEADRSPWVGKMRAARAAIRRSWTGPPVTIDEIIEWKNDGRM